MQDLCRPFELVGVSHNLVELCTVREHLGMSFL
jgi:hypothetical protein